MSGQLEGKVALVTGAGAGIGEGIARRFADEGARVVVAEFDEASGRAVAESVGGTFVACDVSVREQVEAAVAAAVAAYGSIDILVNNAWGGGRSAGSSARPTRRCCAGCRSATSAPTGR